MPFNQLVNEISRTLGFSRSPVISIIYEYKRTGTYTSSYKTRKTKCMFDKIDDSVRNAIRRKIHSFWLRNELPTFDKILEVVNDDPALPNFRRSSFHTIINKLDFVFKKGLRCNILTESEELLIWRHNYIHDIRKYREEGRSIYYIDEMCLNVGDCINQLRIDKTVLTIQDAFNKGQSTKAKNPTGEGQRLVVLHIGSDEGFLDGGLLCFSPKKKTSNEHDEITGDAFHEWFEPIISRLNPNSVIVMDNAPCHLIKSENIPTSQSKKDEILTWLSSKAIHIDKPMLKAQLLVKVRELKSRYNSLIVDNMARAYGHTVLRLPPYHNEFNPIELAWAKVKEYVKQYNTTHKIDDVRTLLNTAIQRVTNENWKNFIQHVIMEEDKMWKIDNMMDEIIDSLEPCILTVTDNISESD